MKILFLFYMLLSQPISEINTIYNIMDKKDLSNAIYTYQASKYYNVNSRLLANLINSESGYKNVSHSLSYVKGMSGINEKVWKIPNRTNKEQIYAGAFVFRKYLDKYKENELEALHGYKGRSNLGKRQALLVYKKYKN